MYLPYRLHSPKQHPPPHHPLQKASLKPTQHPQSRPLQFSHNPEAQRSAAHCIAPETNAEQIICSQPSSHPANTDLPVRPLAIQPASHPASQSTRKAGRPRQV
ncbi:uncharacterized protein BO66DRAFT_7517 [Aspergillus aculeatinus CBS 121060]|uniref:Uncharacterized protein n=1 Tax=Aspergillus aculeatinus CBS 121060 TaxID=1448322 RepID=A0ACD1HP37_9EURO|nr:hypothetical protein BO66DRAFT_7517 [Aspergillus aculeatinus CBS 121060]RAH75380.1 hypothetical protein BO66DRAFT_7517 [Aspergillus aculeatinus CBS 121060]